MSKGFPLTWLSDFATVASPRARRSARVQFDAPTHDPHEQPSCTQATHAAPGAAGLFFSPTHPGRSRP